MTCHGHLAQLRGGLYIGLLPVCTIIAVLASAASLHRDFGGKGLDRALPVHFAHQQDNVAVHHDMSCQVVECKAFLQMANASVKERYCLHVIPCKATIPVPFLQASQFQASKSG